MRPDNVQARAATPALFLVASTAMLAVLAMLLANGRERVAVAAPAPVTNIHAFLERCPTNDPMYAQFRADFEIRREGAVVGAIACTEPISAVPISRYSDELIAVQTLRAIYYLEGARDVANPWTGGSFYDWMKSKIGGIDIRSSGSSCCQTYGGEYFIAIATQNQWDRDDAREWRGLSERVTIFAHETRHVDGYPHVGGCPLFPGVGYGCDPVYDESNLAPYGLGWWLHEAWLSGDIDVGYACLPAFQRNQIATWHLERANGDYRGRFVTNPPPVLTMPAQPGGSCAGATTTATPTATPWPTPTAPPTPVATLTASAAPTMTGTPTATPTLQPSASLSPTNSASPPTESPTNSASPTATVAPSPNPTTTPTPSATPAGPPVVTPPATGPLPPPAPTATAAPTASRQATPSASSSPSTAATATPQPTLGAKADIDCDGDVDANDGLQILRVVSGLATGGDGLCVSGGAAQIAVRGDVDCDGAAGVGDVLAVLRYSAGFGPLPAECGS